jgi:hypothetical protein
MRQAGLYKTGLYMAGLYIARRNFFGDQKRKRPGK